MVTLLPLALPGSPVTLACSQTHFLPPALSLTEGSCSAAMRLTLEGGKASEKGVMFINFFTFLQLSKLLIPL